jgi:pilus assembly protein Flp/PilA
VCFYIAIFHASQRGKILLKLICRLVASQKGATAVEYGLIIAMIVLAMITALSNVATATNNMWSHVANEVMNH